MTRYFTEVSNELLDQWKEPGPAARAQLPEGFQFVEVFLPRPDRDTTIMVVEDDGASPELEGKKVTPTFRAHYAEDGSVESVEIVERSVARSW